MKSLSTYMTEDLRLQQNEQMLNEGLFGLIAKFFKWLFSDDDEPKKNKGKFPWDYDDDDWETPTKPKKSALTVKMTTKTTTKTEPQKPTEQTPTQPTLGQTDVGPTKPKKKKTLTQTVSEITTDKDAKKKARELEKTNDVKTNDVKPNDVSQEQTVDDTPDDTSSEDTVNKKRTTIGVTPPEQPSPKIPVKDLSLTRIDGNVEDPLAVMMAIFEQTGTNIRKKRGLWRAASLIDKKPSATHIDKRPWYIHYSTINYVDKCVIGLLAYSNDPYEYQRLLKDEDHGDYMHVFSFQMIDEYAETDVIDDFVIDELIKIAKENKNVGITIEHCDCEQLLEKHGFETYDDEHQLMILKF